MVQRSIKLGRPNPSSITIRHQFQHNYINFPRSAISISPLPISVGSLYIVSHQFPPITLQQGFSLLLSSILLLLFHFALSPLLGKPLSPFFIHCNSAIFGSFLSSVDHFFLFCLSASFAFMGGLVSCSVRFWLLGFSSFVILGRPEICFLWFLEICSDMSC